VYYGDIIKMFVLECNESNFEELVINSELPVVVDFYATWCGPCKAIKPALEKLAEKYQTQVRIVAIDTDENQDLASEYGIRSLPTIKLFTSSSVLEETIVGATTPDKLEAKIKTLIGE
jgi:thioredoxin 1